MRSWTLTWLASSRIASTKHQLCYLLLNCKPLIVLVLCASMSRALARAAGRNKECLIMYTGVRWCYGRSAGPGCLWAKGGSRLGLRWLAAHRASKQVK